MKDLPTEPSLNGFQRAGQQDRDYPSELMFAFLGLGVRCAARYPDAVLVTEMQGRFKKGRVLHEKAFV